MIFLIKKFLINTDLNLNQDFFSFPTRRLHRRIGHILFSSYSLDDGSYKDGNEGTIQIIYNKCILEVKECQIDTP